MSENMKRRLIGAAILLGVAGLTYVLIVNRAHIQDFAALGYPGIFLVALMSSATVLVPGPGLMITTAMGAVFNPFWVAIAAGLGAGLGEITGYLVGFSGRELVNKTFWHERVDGWIKKYGLWVILVMAIIPNPVFDLVGYSAGVSKLPLWKFLLAACCGNILKMMFFSFGGAGVLWFFFPAR
jgi:uncharacterized membrane protein YdjX (TVP38/TMEM64 family)